MRFLKSVLISLLLLAPSFAVAQSGYISPDGRSRYPAVTVFCPSGTGVAPCNFGGGGGGGAVTINLGSSAVAAGNPFPVTDSTLESTVSGGTLRVSGAVSVNLGGSAVAPSNPFPVTDSALEAVISGGALRVGGTVAISSLPLPAGAAADATVAAPLAPVAPGTATASKSLLLGCLSNTTLPAFAAGQQGAVPCDSVGRPYVVTVPSSNNVPSYLQAVSSGGATVFSAANAAASCMATNIKTSSGLLYSYSVSNSNSAGVWFRIFGSATAPACGSGTPVKRVYVPAGATVALSTAVGWTVPNGIGFDVTSGGGADTDTATVASAASVLVNIDYK